MFQTKRQEWISILVFCIAGFLIENADSQDRTNYDFNCDPGTGNALSQDGSYYLQLSSCIACNVSNCANCTANYALTTCPSCLNGYGLSADGMTCSPCKANCNRCNNNISHCDQCSGVEFGPVLDGTDDGACDDCAADCADCSESGAGKCDVCRSSFAFNYSMTPAPCQPCYPVGCISCVIEGPGKCDDCLSEYGSDDGVHTGPRCELCEPANCQNCYSYSEYCILCYGNLTVGNDGQCQPNTINFALRIYWNALDARDRVPIPWRPDHGGSPLLHVIIHHSHNKLAITFGDCSIRMQAMQKDQMGLTADGVKWGLKLPDLNYHFAFCGDGSIFVIRGWNYQCKRRQSFPNVDVYNVLFIGNFEKGLPPTAATDSLDKWVAHGKPYNLHPTKTHCYGHRDISCRSNCPGKEFYNEYVKKRSDWGGVQTGKCGQYTRGAGHPSRK